MTSAGGLENWDYISPFEDVEVAFDDVDTALRGRYLTEASEMLRSVHEDVASRLVMDNSAGQEDNDAFSPLTRLEAVRTFLPDSILEKLAAIANQGLRLRKKPATTAHEMLGLIILHVLCANYDEAPVTVCNPNEAGNFLQIGFSAQRYKDVWSA